MRHENPLNRIKFLERKLDIYEENYKRLYAIFDSNERLYHDINHHLQVLRYMAEKSGKEEFVNYIDGISSPGKELTKYIWSGVDIVDVILNHMVTECEENGIDIKVNAEFPQNEIVTADDVCTILFNLLDNAKEACQSYITINGDKPIIDVNIRYIRGFIIIKVKNPVVVKPEKKIGRFITTKSNKKHHGYGMVNVEKTAGKYNGNFEIEIEDNNFTATVMLCVGEENVRRM